MFVRSRPQSSANPARVARQALGIESDGPLDTGAIKKAFKTTVKRFHPDNSSANAESEVLYRARFDLARKAKDLLLAGPNATEELKDFLQAKKVYDEELCKARQTKAASAPPNEPPPANRGSAATGRENPRTGRGAAGPSGGESTSHGPSNMGGRHNGRVHMAGSTGADEWRAGCFGDDAHMRNGSGTARPFRPQSFDDPPPRNERPEPPPRTAKPDPPPHANASASGATGQSRAQAARPQDETKSGPSPADDEWIVFPHTPGVTKAEPRQTDDRLNQAAISQYERTQNLNPGPPTFLADLYT